MPSPKPSERKHGIPPFTESQRAGILEMLRAAGPAGVSKETFLFEKRWSQAAARVWELEQQGFQIAHLQRDGETYVRYVLESEPLELRPTDGSDWYERITGKPRTGNPDNVPDLPLFPGGDS
jgi:hypothetical protein